MDFYTLDSSDIAQYNKWVDIWQNWNSREIFAHPDYVRMFLRDADKAICAVQESPEGFILLPMILRPLSVESWTDKQNSYYDAITPYGYGGPYTEGCADIDFFWLQVQRWAAENHIISIFFRFSPVAVIISGFMGKVESCGDVIIRSLTEGKEAVWNDYKHAVRTCIRCAAQHGLTIEIDEFGTKLQDFIRIYYMTMDRRNASKQYYFSEGFFRNLIEKLQGHFAFFHVLHKGVVIASKLVLISNDRLYPYLGGSDHEYFNVYPNQFLDHAIFNWGIDSGKKDAVLGGGYDGLRDGVFEYKKKFAPSGEVPFFVGKYIVDHAKYNEMIEKRIRYEMGDAQESCNGDCFFPAYRRKSD